MREWILLAVVIGATMSARAEEAPQTLHLKKIEHSGSLLKYFYADIYTLYHGPTLDSLGSAYSVDATGRMNRAATTGLESEILAGYVLDRERLIGVGPDVSVINAPVPGQHFVMGDSGVRVFWKKTVDTPTVRVSTDIYLLAPTSPASRSRNMDYAIKTTPFAWYDVDRYRIGTWSELRYFAGVTEGTALKAYLAPFLQYSFNDRLVLNVIYEMEGHRDIGMGPLQFTNYQTDLAPGLIWKVTRDTFLNPYLKFFPRSPLGAGTTSIGVALYSVLL